MWASAHVRILRKGNIEASMPHSFRYSKLQDSEPPNLYPKQAVSWGCTHKILAKHHHKAWNGTEVCQGERIESLSEDCHLDDIHIWWHQRTLRFWILEFIAMLAIRFWFWWDSSFSCPRVHLTILLWSSGYDFDQWHCIFADTYDK